MDQKKGEINMFKVVVLTSKAKRADMTALPGSRGCSPLKKEIMDHTPYSDA